MLAVDTNVIVRYLTGDHPRQSAQARALVDGDDIFVSTTVLLETEWVLRSVYEFAPDQVRKALVDFAGLARVSLEDAALAALALDRMKDGMDFADALHLGRAEACDAFMTFDRRLVRTASAIGIESVRNP
jgi:predicted nucleic-acid-binding protein